MKKILVIQTAFAGDLILTLPLIQTAHAFFSPCEIDVLCIPSTEELLTNHPSISHVIVYDKKSDRYGVHLMTRLRKVILRRSYDIVLSPHRSFRSAMISRMSCAARRVTFNTSAGKSLYTDIVDYRNDLHEIERVLSLMSVFGSSVQYDRQAKLFPTEKQKKKVDSFFREHHIDRPVIAIAPGSVWATKRWTVEGFTRLTSQCIQDGFDVVLIGGERDRNIVESIRSHNQIDHCYSTIDKFSFLESAGLLQHASVLVSNDSAPVHIASAMGVPVVDIFGATVPEFGFAPYGVPHRVVQKHGLACKPCAMHGGNACPIKTFVCMKELRWEEVYSAVQALLDE